MATRLKEVDAVMVGMGWTGSIMARELTKAGLTVVGLERGEDITPREHFALPNVRDELKYSQRLELIQDPALETVTFRHRPSDPRYRCAAWVVPAGQHRRRRRQSLGRPALALSPDRSSHAQPHR